MKSLHVICLLRILNDQLAYWIDFSAVCSAFWTDSVPIWSIDRKLNQCSIDCLEFTDHPGYLVVKWRMRKFSVHGKSILGNFRFLRLRATACHYLNRDYIRLWQLQMKDKCAKEHLNALSYGYVYVTELFALILIYAFWTWYSSFPSLTMTLRNLS